VLLTTRSPSALTEILPDCPGGALAGKHGRGGGGFPTACDAPNHGHFSSKVVQGTVQPCRPPGQSSRGPARPEAGRANCRRSLRLGGS
jgi:hypothetical protein